MTEKAKRSRFGLVEFFSARQKKIQEEIAAVKAREEKQRKLAALGVRTVKLGILADHGRVIQQVGNETFNIRVSDVEPSIKPLGNFYILSDAAEIIELKCSMDDRSLPPYRKWFSQAVNLYEIFANTDLLTIRLDAEDVPLSAEAIEKAWREEGLPEIVGSFFQDSIHIERGGNAIPIAAAPAQPA